MVLIFEYCTAKVFLHSAKADSGAVICKRITDTVRFGGITMDSFNFGSCYGEIDLFYPERYRRCKLF